MAGSASPRPAFFTWFPSGFQTVGRSNVCFASSACTCSFFDSADACACTCAATAATLVPVFNVGIEKKEIGGLRCGQKEGTRQASGQMHGLSQAMG